MLKSSGKMLSATAFCAALLPCVAMAETLIPLPFDEAGETVVVSETYILSEDRLKADRHRGTHVETAKLPQTVLSPMHPSMAGVQKASGSVRFSGERQAVDFTVFVPDPSVVKALRIATVSSLNILPETSGFVVWLNDVQIGEGPLDSFVDYEAVEFPVDPNLLQKGRNRVRVELVQRHRIFCGPDAAFALWSDLSLAKSGIVLADDETLVGPGAFMMGVASVAASGAGLEVRGADAVASQNPTLLRDIAEALAGSLGGDPLPLRFTSYWSVQQQGAGAARVTLVPSDVTRVSFQRAGDGAEVLVVEYNRARMSQGLPELRGLLPAPEQRTPLAMIKTNEPVRFAEFGFTNAEVRDRHTRLTQQFLLPEDYVVLTSEKAEMQLDYAYMPDLPRGAVLILKVNGQSVSASTLTGEGTRARAKSTLRFEASRLRPGINEITFEVLIPGSPEDQACPSRIEPFLMIGENSTLYAPHTPSFYLPDMHLGLAGLRPRDVQTAPLAETRFSQTDVLSIMAALNASAPNEVPLGSRRLDLMSLEDLAASDAAPYKPALRSVEVAFGEAPTTEEGVDEEEPKLVYLTPRDRFDPAKFAEETWNSITTTAKATLNWVSQRDTLSLDDWLQTQRAQAILIQPNPVKVGELVLLRNENSDMVAISAALASARVSAHGPRGQVSVLDHKGHWQNWIDPHLKPALLEPITKDNLRQVVGNYASVMPGGYVALLFLLAFLAGSIALKLTLSTRETRK